MVNHTLLQLYYRLPDPARSIAASLRGYYLRAWRYGPEIERLVEEAFERDRWSALQWKNWREARQAHVLRRAATEVPYYREQWQARRRRGDRVSWELLENWPVLEKESLRKNPTAFVAGDRAVRRMYYEHTSGTTGKSLDLWSSRETLRTWYALCEARWRRWYGVSRHDRWAILGGQLVTPVTQRRPAFWVWNAALNQLYMSSYHLAPDLIPHYLDALSRYRIKYLWGYTSSLYSLSQETLRLGRRDLKMTVAISNAEPLHEHQRQAIAEAFQCPVRETYGMAEMVAAASECPAGRMHLWPEVGIVEVFEGDQPVRCGTPGDLVCTGLLNTDMPLIRYRVGDRGTLPATDSLCGCGRTLPALVSVEGRIDDVLYTADGRCVGCIDTLYDAQLPVREAQIIQETLDRVRVRFVPAPEWTPEAGRSIIEGMRARMGAVEVILEEVNEVPRGASGKFRAVICHLPVEERKRLAKVSR